MFCRAPPADAISMSTRSLLRCIVALMLVCLAQLGFAVYAMLRVYPSPDTVCLVQVVVPSVYALILLTGFAGIRRRSICLLKVYYVIQSICVVVSTGLITGFTTYMVIQNPKLVDAVWTFTQHNQVLVAISVFLSFALFVIKLRSIFFARVLSLQLGFQQDQAIELANMDDEQDESPQQQVFIVPQPMFAAPANGQEALYMQVPSHANLVPIYVDRSGNYVH